MCFSVAVFAVTSLSDCSWIFRCSPFIRDSRVLFILIVLSAIFSWGAHLCVLAWWEGHSLVRNSQRTQHSWDSIMAGFPCTVFLSGGETKIWGHPWMLVRFQYFLQKILDVLKSSFNHFIKCLILFVFYYVVFIIKLEQLLFYSIAWLECFSDA